MIRYTYDNGLPFSDIYKENIEDLNKRVEERFASLLIIDGGVGKGKTTLCVHTADYINKLHGFPEIKFKEQLATGGADFLKKIRICYDKKLPVIIYSEAGDFNKRGALSKFNAMLTRTFETFRAFKIVVLLDLPNFNVLDNGLFDNNIPRLLIHVDNRDMNYGNFSGYSLYRMFYLRKKMEKLTVKTFAYELVHPNFRGHFLNLPPAREKALDLYTVKGKLKTLRGAEIDMEGLLSYNKMAAKLGKSVSWIRQQCYKLKIKESRTINKVKYFNEVSFNRLADLLEK